MLQITFVEQEDLPTEISTAQDMVSFMNAKNEKDENQPTNDSSVKSAEDSEVNSLTEDDMASTENHDFKNKESREQYLEEELSRLRVLFQPPQTDKSDQLELQRGGLTFEELVELLQYSSKSYKPDEICKLMNIQPSQIEIILEQLKTLKGIIRNRATKTQITSVSKKLLKFLKTQSQK